MRRRERERYKKVLAKLMLADISAIIIIFMSSMEVDRQLEVAAGMVGALILMAIAYAVLSYEDKTRHLHHVPYLSAWERTTLLQIPEIKTNSALLNLDKMIERQQRQGVTVDEIYDVAHWSERSAEPFQSDEVVLYHFRRDDTDQLLPLRFAGERANLFDGIAQETEWSSNEESDENSEIDNEDSSSPLRLPRDGRHRAESKLNVAEEEEQSNETTVFFNR